MYCQPCTLGQVQAGISAMGSGTLAGALISAQISAGFSTTFSIFYIQQETVGNNNNPRNNDL